MNLNKYRLNYKEGKLTRGWIKKNKYNSTSTILGVFSTTAVYNQYGMLGLFSNENRREGSWAGGEIGKIKKSKKKGGNQEERTDIEYARI